MSDIEFIGMIQAQKVSEIHPARGPAIDRDYVRAFAQAHEQAGFDRVLVPHHSTSPDATLTVAYAASVTERIHFMLAHRPGFVRPTLAARQFASLDQFSGGRLGVHYISGGSDDEQKRDGDWLDHDQRYARTDEYLDVLRKVWTADQPFDHEGAHYRFKDAFSEVKPVQTRTAGRTCRSISAAPRKRRSRWPASMPTSTRCGASRSTRRANYRPRARRSRQARPRSVRFSVSFRPILADTEAEAWERADTHPGRDPPPARGAGLRSRRPAAERGRQAPAGRGRAGDAARQAAVDRRRPGDRRPLEQHGAGRHAGAGGRRAARLPRRSA